MIPWPIAMVVVFYAMLATASASTLWNIASGRLQGSAVWPSVWFGLSAILVMGLAFLKAWARQVAVWASLVMMFTALGVAYLVIATPNPQPARSLLATGMAGIHLVVIRYLTRPHVKGWFSPVAKW